MTGCSRLWLASVVSAAVLTASCSPGFYRRQADRRAYEIVERARQEALGKHEPFTIEPAADALRRRLLLDQRLVMSHPATLGTGALDKPAHWPEKHYPFADRAWHEPPVLPAEAGTGPLVLSLTEALQVAAGNNREYQTAKEAVFRSALALDLEADEFRSVVSAAVDTFYVEDRTGEDPVRGVESTTDLSISRRFQQGATVTAGIAMDLVALLHPVHSESLGLRADASVTVPLLRGAGRHIVAEPLTQAQRDVIYSLYALERNRRALAVRVASDYLGVLQQLDQIDNAEENYCQVILSTRRARRLAEAGRLPAIQVDQALQDELRARDRWIAAQQTYVVRLDAFKVLLGLPADARVLLKREELKSLARSAREAMAGAASPAAPATATPSPGMPDEPSAREVVTLVPPSRQGGPLEMRPERAIRVALDNRLDLRTEIAQVYDAQRRVVVAADALRAALTLVGSAAAGEGRSLGSADLPNADIRPERGVYTAGLLLDLPTERTAERNAYRNSLIELERAVRGVQGLEDRIKLDVRNALGELLRARESYAIQAQAARVAERRVASTELFLQAGRAEMRDVLEAQEALLSARNAVTAALVDYRVTALELQRDMDVLEVDEKGLWREYQPDRTDEAAPVAD